MGGDMGVLQRGHSVHRTQTSTKHPADLLRITPYGRDDVTQEPLGRRQVLFGLGALATTSVVAACGGSDSTADEVLPAAAIPTTADTVTPQPAAPPDRRIPGFKYTPAAVAVAVAPTPRHSQGRNDALTRPNHAVPTVAP